MLLVRIADVQRGLAPPQVDYGGWEIRSTCYSGPAAGIYTPGVGRQTQVSAGGSYTGNKYCISNTFLVFQQHFYISN